MNSPIAGHNVHGIFFWGGGIYLSLGFKDIGHSLPPQRVGAILLKVDIKPRLGVLILIYLWFQEGRGGYKIIWNHVGTIEEKAMAPQSSTLAWKILWMEEPGGLQSMGSLKVGHDWTTSLSLFTFLHWRRKWQPTPVFLPGESQGRGSLVGCRLWDRTESDTTKATQQQQGN